MSLKALNLTAVELSASSAIVVIVDVLLDPILAPTLLRFQPLKGLET
jgi:hypothetical protein